MSLITPLTGKLKLTFVKANDLPRKQLLGKQDPYVRVHFGDKKVKSKVHENGDKNPEWGDQVSINCNDYGERMIKFMVKNDNLGRDDDIALIRIPIFALLSHQGEEREYPLFKSEKNKKRCGRITLKAELEGKGGLPSNDTQSVWGIQEATFGNDDVQINVKGYLDVRATVSNGTIHFKSDQPLSEFFGFDPLNGHDKALKIKYSKGGVVNQLEVRENHSNTTLEFERAKAEGVTAKMGNLSMETKQQPVVAPIAPVVQNPYGGQPVHVQPVQTYGQAPVQTYGQQPVYAGQNPGFVAPPVRTRVQLVVPQGMVPGQQFAFLHNGKQYTATVPQGMYSGQRFEVQV